MSGGRESERDCVRECVSKEARGREIMIQMERKREEHERENEREAKEEREGDRGSRLGGLGWE